GIDDNLYSKKGITPSLALAPLVLLNDVLPDAPLQATAHLFNAIISTLTALMLFDVVARLGYDKKTAFITGLMLGWGSLYWVYTQTLFGEPLAGLLVMVILRLVLIEPHPPDPLLQTGEGGENQNSPYEKSPLHLERGFRGEVSVICAILLGLLAGINLTYIAFIPIFAGYLFIRTRRFRDLIFMAIGAIITIIIVVGMLNWSRYGAFTETGYKFGDGEGFSTPLLTGLYGLYVSPWRGMIWYMPLIWLAPIGLWLTYRKNQSLALFIVVCVAVQSVIYAMWWSWHGGVVWGARFLVPIIPLLILSFAPLVQSLTSPLNPPSKLERGLQPTRKTGFLPLLHVGEGGRGDAVWRIFASLILITLFILSIFMQLLGTLYDFNTHEGVLYAQHEDKLDNALMNHPELSAIGANLTMFINGELFHWAWIKHGDAVIVLIAIGMIASTALLALIRHRYMPILALIIVCMGMAITAIRGESDVDRAKRHDLQNGLSPAAPIIATTDDTRLINLRGFRDIRTVYAPTSPDDPFISQLWDSALADRGLHWFVTWFNPANPENWMERELFTQHAFAKEIWAGDYRAVLFYVNPVELNLVNANWIFGDTIRLKRYGIERYMEGIFITLDWEYADNLPPNWNWFVHVLDENSAIIAQQDRIPLGGYAPTDGAIDRLYLLTSLQPAMSVRVGWVADGAIIPVLDSDGVTSDFIVLPIPRR
ncbi:MAG: hypothetical protein KJ043_08445, partial [Anaerolineae bacterium]|nr:hypothetical protein [Anaerolineae bacterium]